MQSRAKPCKAVRFKPEVERLEPRDVAYAAARPWPSPVVTLSFVPDGANSSWDSAPRPSNLFAAMDRAAPRAQWQAAISSALREWCDASGLVFGGVVGDDGAGKFGTGLMQGDPRRGDVRVFGAPMGTSGPLGLGIAPPPAAGTGYTHWGDVFLNTDRLWSLPKLNGVALHEIGHALGLEHATTWWMQNGYAVTPVMWPSYRGQLDLTRDDVAGVRALYGPDLGAALESIALEEARRKRAALLALNL